MNRFQLEAAVRLALIEAGIPSTSTVDLAALVRRLCALADLYREASDGERQQLRRRVEAPGARKAH